MISRLHNQLFFLEIGSHVLVYTEENDTELLILLSVHPKCWDFRHVVPPQVYKALEIKPRGS